MYFILKTGLDSRFKKLFIKLLSIFIKEKTKHIKMGVSISINHNPAFNSSKFIAEAIQSVQDNPIPIGKYY
jgi:hypothetical protein